MSVTEATKTTAELLAYLKETGTGSLRLEKIKAFVTQSARENDVDPEPGEVVEWMIGNNIPSGTVRKAGEWVYGPSFSLNRLVDRKEDDATMLRSEIAQKEKAHAEELAAAAAENRRLRIRVAQLESMVSADSLKKGSKLKSASTEDLPVGKVTEEDNTLDGFDRGKKK